MQLGLERLALMLQMRRVKLNELETVFFQKDQFKFSQNIRIPQLQKIFFDLLGLNENEALDFARFVLEERDSDDNETQLNTIEYDPNKKINV